MKLLTNEELVKLSVDQLKMEYAKLAKVYARRMYERSKEDNELFELLYGERKTTKQLEKFFLEGAEKSHYIEAYKQLAAAMGGEIGMTKLDVKTKIKIARDYAEKVGKKNISNKEAVKKWKAHMTKFQASQDWYEWYEELVEDYGDVMDKSEAGRMSRDINGLAAVEEEFKKRFKEAEEEEEIEMEEVLNILNGKVKGYDFSD